MTPPTATQKADALISALEQYGQGDYIGEPISQLEHCLQAAHQARNSGTSPALPPGNPFIQTQQLLSTNQMQTQTY